MDRSIHELLKIVRKDIVQNGVITGMCGVVWRLYEANIIRDSEEDLILHYLNLNKPSSLQGLYFFPYGEAAPRIEFLNKHIELTKP